MDITFLEQHFSNLKGLWFLKLSNVLFCDVSSIRLVDDDKEFTLTRG